MGNVIHGGREKKIDPAPLIVTVRDVGALKAKANEARRRRESTTDQTDHILQGEYERKYFANGIKSQKLASIDETLEQSSTNDSEKEVLKFVHRYKVQYNFGSRLSDKNVCQNSSQDIFPRKYTYYYPKRG